MNVQATSDQRVNIEIHIPDISMTTCIWAPASITMQELRDALVNQLHLDPSYRALSIESNGARSTLSGQEVLSDLLAASKDAHFYLEPEQDADWRDQA